MNGQGVSVSRQLALLDSGALRARRIELRMTENQLGRRIGKSGQLVRRIEAGLSHEGLTLRVLARLAAALGVPMRSLVLGDASAAPTASAEHRAEAAILALLVDHGGALSEAVLATALRRSLPAVRESVGALAGRLRGTGLILERSANGVAVVPDRNATKVGANEALQALWRARPIGSREAGMLLRVIAGEVRATAALDRPSGMILAKLAEAGAIELPAGLWASANPPRVGAAVAFSLLLAGDSFE